MKEYIRKTLIDAAYRLRIPPARTIVSHFTSEHERSIQRLLNLYRTDLVLDVGANTGQFAKSILKCGYRGAIESFEPLAREYQSIQSVLHWEPTVTFQQLVRIMVEADLAALQQSGNHTPRVG